MKESQRENIGAISKNKMKHRVPYSPYIDSSYNDLLRCLKPLARIFRPL
jgi:hypothetical protein